MLINGSITLTADGMGWEYPQTDSEGSGATDENLMIREVLPERDKLILTFERIRPRRRSGKFCKSGR